MKADEKERKLIDLITEEVRKERRDLYRIPWKVREAFLYDVVRALMKKYNLIKK